jgi:Uma2 family endonuclease
MVFEGQKLYTVDEFEQLIAQSDSQDRLLELINGVIVEKMPTEEHSLIVGNIYITLRVFVDKNGLGRVAFEVRRKMPGDEHNARLPDVEFTRKDRLLPIVKKGAVPQMPDLAVEVKSPDDSYQKLRDKAAYYLANGTQIVWLVYPEKQMVEIQTLDDFEYKVAGQILDGGDLLPGFTMKVDDIFAG